MTYSQQMQNMGTTRWMAPETIKFENDDGTQAREVGLKYPFKSDVYSFAKVCFEILTGDAPFSALSPREVKSMVLGGSRPESPDECLDRLRTLIEACWSSEATTRPRFDDICAVLRHLKCERLMIAAWAKVSRSFSLDMLLGNLDAEIFSLGLKHEREIPELEWVFALQPAVHVPAPPVPPQEPVLAKKRSRGSPWLSWFRKDPLSTAGSRPPYTPALGNNIPFGPRDCANDVTDVTWCH